MRFRCGLTDRGLHVRRKRVRVFRFTRLQLASVASTLPTGAEYILVVDTLPSMYSARVDDLRIIVLD